MGQNLSLVADLNSNVLEHIVDFFTLDSVLNLRAAHHVFADLIDSHFTVHLTLPMKKKDADQEDFFQKPILRITQTENEDVVNDEPINTAFIRKLRTSRVKELLLECPISKSNESQITNLSQKIFFNLIHKHSINPMKHVTKISISLKPGASSRIVSFGSISRCMPNVAELNIYGCLPYQYSSGSEWCAPICLPNLEIFTYKYLNVPDEKDEAKYQMIRDYLGRCPKIKEVKREKLKMMNKRKAELEIKKEKSKNKKIEESDEEKENRKDGNEEESDEEEDFKEESDEEEDFKEESDEEEDFNDESDEEEDFKVKINDENESEEENDEYSNEKRGGEKDRKDS